MIKQLKEKIYREYEKHNTISYIIIILIAILISIPLFANGFITTHDGTAHLSRNYGTIYGIKKQILLSAIVPNFCGGFGYSWNLFYPPLSTYISAIFYFLIPEFTIAIKLTITLAIICAGIFMFKFMQELTKNKNTSLLISTIYITSTYFITNIYMRLAVGEIMTFVFLPLLFWGLYSILYEKGKRNWLLTIGAVGILLSHNISSIIAAILCIIIILFHWKKLFKNENSKQIWKNLFINAFFIILIVSFFMIPLLEHSLATEYVAMAKNGMTSKELVLNSTINLEQLIMALGLIIVIPLLFTPICYKKIEKDKRHLYIGILILGITISLISTTKFLWNILPDIFFIIQFPWRILLFSTFFLSIIAGININKTLVNNNFPKLFTALLISIIYSSICICTIIQPNNNFDISYLYKTENIENIYVFSQQCTNYDYLPVKARTPYINNREDKTIILQGEANISNEKKEGSNMMFNVKCGSKDSTLELPYIYYLGYNIKLNEKEIQYKESENGFISITIPKESEGIVQVEYKGTKLSQISIVISATRDNWIYCIY